MKNLWKQLLLLWFDVEKRRYTTRAAAACARRELWFDVEKRRYTTNQAILRVITALWFDVEKRRYTTRPFPAARGGVVV